MQEFQFRTANVVQGIWSQEINVKTCLGWVKPRAPQLKANKVTLWEHFRNPGHMWAGLQDGSSWGSHMPLPFPVAALLSAQISVCRFSCHWRERTVEERPAEGLHSKSTRQAQNRLTSESKDAAKTFRVETGDTSVSE